MLSLIEGYRRFRETAYREHRALYEALVARGQSPRAMVIGCSDSRVDPAILFGTEPGEIFVVRNVANLVPPFAQSGNYHGTSAALEFAVRSLEVEHVIVLGHARCGGIAALLNNFAGLGSDFIRPWMQIAAPAREKAVDQSRKAGADAQRCCEHEAIKVSLGNLQSFPWIAERVRAGKLQLHGWYFDLETGELLQLRDEHFQPV
ncbi:MAG: putative Carbonic anhydrase [Rhodospirillales bacterium]|jgi:carbonic anhydrase|nr:putative Carbonic anhydrase [Rhodospirillales bacterium]